MRTLIANALELVALLVLVARERVLAADTSKPAPRREVSSGPAVATHKSGSPTQVCVGCKAYQAEAYCDVCVLRIMCSDIGAEA